MCPEHSTWFDYHYPVSLTQYGKTKNRILRGHPTPAAKRDRIWKDDAGKNRIRAEIVEIYAADAKLVLESSLKEAIRQEVGNLQRNLISYSSVESSTVGTFKTRSMDTVYWIDRSKHLDPIPGKKFVIDKTDLKFNGLYVPVLDTLVAEYEVIHNLEVFRYYRRPGRPPFNVFRRKQAVAEIKFHNPGSQGDSLLL